MIERLNLYLNIPALDLSVEMTSHSAVRGESYSRKRSSTISSTSLFKNVPAPPLQLGHQTTMSTWVSDSLAVPVVLNHECWPGVSEGDMIQVTTQANAERPGFLFIVRDDTGLPRQTQQQVHSSNYTLQPISDMFREFRSR